MSGPSYPMSCPQCMNTTFTIGAYKLPASNRDGYAPLLDAHEEHGESAEVERVHGGENAV